MYFHNYKDIQFFPRDFKAKNGVVSQRVVCCGVKTWTFVIGWTQTVLSALAVIFFLYKSISTAYHLQSVPAAETTELTDHCKNLKTVSGVIGLAVSLAGLIGGIILVSGWKKENSKKIQAWIFIQIGLLAVITLWALFQLICGNSSVQLIEFIILDTVGICFIWIVNVYRKEIIANGTVRPVRFLL